MKLKKWIFLVLIFGAEIWLLSVFRQPILKAVAFLSTPAANAFDDILIGLIASVLFSALQLVNELVVTVIMKCSNDLALKILRWIFKCRDDQIKAANRQMMDFVFSSDPKWGVYQRSEVYKNANTAEGILACSSAAEETLQ